MINIGFWNRILRWRKKGFEVEKSTPSPTCHSQRKRRRRRTDGRSCPNLKPCPPNEQRYLIRKVGYKTLKCVAKGLKSIPSENAIERFVTKHNLGAGTYTILSTKPRPKHVITYRIRPKDSEMDPPSLLDFDKLHPWVRDRIRRMKD